MPLANPAKSSLEEPSCSSIGTELVAQAEQPSAVVARQDLVVLVEVGDVVQVHADAPVLRGGDIAGRLLERAQAAAEDELLVVASSLQIKRKQKTTKAAIHKAVTEVVDQVSPTVTCHCAFSPAKTDPCLQVADYLTWAVQRKYERGDSRSYELVKHLIKSDYDYFRFGTKTFF